MNSTLTRFPSAIWIAFVSITAAIVLAAVQVSGPFIILDEPVYFNMARLFFREGYISGAQYGPLYPVLLSPAFILDDPAHALLAVRLINALTQASVVFPYFLVARRLTSEREIATLASVLASTMPFLSLSLIIWAEPLLFALWAWSIVAFLRFVEAPSRERGMLLGMGIALAYMTKQAALLMFAAIIVAFVWDAWHLTAPGKRRALLFRQAVPVGTAGLLIGVWILRNKLEAWGDGGLGYADSWARLEAKLASPWRMLEDTFWCLMNSIGYLACAMYGALFLAAVAWCLHLKKLKRHEAMLAVVLGTAISGLIFLTSVYHAVYESRIPMGRYLDAATPLLLICAVCWVSRGAMRSISRRWLACGVALTVFIVLVFSPLTYLFAYSYVSNASTTYLHQAFMLDRSEIWVPYPASWNERGAVALMIGAMACFAFARSWRGSLAVAIAVQVASTPLALANVSNLGQEADSLNDLFRRVTHLQSRDYRHPVVFDNIVEHTQILGGAIFWTGQPPKYVDIDALGLRYKFDFGHADLRTKPGALRIAAPWVGASIYHPDRRFGFEAIDRLDGQYCADATPEGRTDWIVSDAPGSFLLDLPAGTYDVTVSAQTACRSTSSDFQISFDGDVSAARVTGSEYRRSFRVNVDGRALRIHLTPSPKGIWALDILEVVPIAPSQDDPRDGQGAVLLVTRRVMPLPEVGRVSTLKIYFLDHRLQH